MILTYNEVIKKYGNKYMLSKAVEDKKIYKIEKGYYSDNEHYSQLEYIMKKYPKCIFTSQSAFLYLGLSDYIPSVYFIATRCNTQKIPLHSIKQTYESGEYYGLGKTTSIVNGVTINIYDKERMLIELIRNQNKYSFDYYKELIHAYREIIDELDMDKLMDYLDVFKNGNSILAKLNREVF